MRMQPSINNTIPVIDNLIVNIRDEKNELNTILGTTPIDVENELRTSLRLLAGHLVNLRTRMDEYQAWANVNAQAYNDEVTEIKRLCTIHFPGVNILGQAILTFYPIFQPAPLSHPPNPQPIVVMVPPSTAAKAARIVLLLGGGALFITGIAYIVTSGIKLAGAITANEAAKKVGEAAAKKAAEELAKRLAIQAGGYLSVGIGQAAIGGITVWQGTKIGLPTRRRLVPAPQGVNHQNGNNNNP